MKRFFMMSVAVMIAAVATAGSYVPKEGEVRFKVLQTTKDKPLHEVLNTPFSHHYYSLHKPIDLDAAKPSHEYFGIGVSLTDASCWLLSQLDAESRHKLMKTAFTKRGLNLSMIRLNCGSSDYATELYNYNETKGDVEMKNFSIARDEQYMIPMIKLVSQYCPEVYTFSSVWSMPGWMKSNGQMCGGSLLDEYMPAFANYWAAYLKAYKAHGINIDAVTVQNEPSTDQRGGCPATLVSAKQEIELAGKYMPQAFKSAGLDTKIWIWDHDYIGWERVVEMLGDKRVQRNAEAVAWHPYSGKPEMLQEVLRRYPGTKMHLTERGPSFAMAAVQNQVWWAEYVFGALNNGCSSFSSWNLLLDEDGQPNTGRHPCAGLLSIDLETGTVTESTQAAFFRQFSPYVKRGAKILSIEQPEEGMTAIAFRNPEGDYVVVVAAHDKPLKRQRVQIKFKDQYMALCLPMNTWSLTTVLIDKQ
ncbi:MAG: hypothetical protein E7130_01050 [Rikenellaceae bacterium]|nr:hypothetical protein [Rikenellaceae bacterium]